MKRFIKAAVATTTLATATMGIGTTASAQPIVTGGLVNVTITDSLNEVVTVVVEDVNLGVAAAVAASLCDTNVNVLARQFRSGDASCTTEAGDTVRITQS